MIKFKLEKVLEERDITMYQLHKATGIRANTISQWTNNNNLPEDKQVKSVSINVLDAVCRELKCEISDIIEYVPDEQNEAAGE